MRLVTHPGRPGSRSWPARRSWLGAAAAGLSFVAVAVWAGAPPALAVPATPAAVIAAPVPRIDHVFLIMEENNGFHDVIGAYTTATSNEIPLIEHR
jgi:phospholipase C